ncbi:hypothetical protein RSAG8_11152, partial [Rhizoctonia solani AG-8 WAC10335]
MGALNLTTCNLTSNSYSSGSEELQGDTKSPVDAKEDKPQIDAAEPQASNRPQGEPQVDDEPHTPNWAWHKLRQPTNWLQRRTRPLPALRVAATKKWKKRKKPCDETSITSDPLPVAEAPLTRKPRKRPNQRPPPPAEESMSAVEASSVIRVLFEFDHWCSRR